MGYALNTGRGFDIEVVCENGTMSVREQDGVWELCEPGATDHRGRQILVPGDFPSFEQASSTLRLIEDLVQALDTGQPTRGGVRAARQSTELIFRLYPVPPAHRSTRRAPADGLQCGTAARPRPQTAQIHGRQLNQITRPRRSPLRLGGSMLTPLQSACFSLPPHGPISIDN